MVERDEEGGRCRRDSSGGGGGGVEKLCRKHGAASASHQIQRQLVGFSRQHYS